MNSNTSGEAEEVQYYVHVLAFINLFVCAVALSTSLIFRKQRIFPVSVVSWLSASDTVFSAYLVFITSHVPAVDKLYVNTFNTCRMLLTIQVFFLLSSITISTLLAFTVHELIRRLKDMSVAKHPNYRRAFVAIFWIMTIGFALGIGLSSGHFVLSICVPPQTAVAFLFVPYALGICLQCFFIGSTLVHMYQVSSKVTLSKELTAARAKKDRLVHLRFVAIVFIQVLKYLPQFVFWFAVYGGDGQSYSFIQLVVYTNAAGFLADSFVIIASNKSLRAWILKSTLGIEDSSKESPATIPLDIQNPTL